MFHRKLQYIRKDKSYIFSSDCDDIRNIIYINWMALIFTWNYNEWHAWRYNNNNNSKLKWNELKLKLEMYFSFNMRYLKNLWLLLWILLVAKTINIIHLTTGYIVCCVTMYFPLINVFMITDYIVKDLYYVLLNKLLY